MNKILGILLLLVYVCAASALLSDAFVTPFNMQNVVRYSALYGIIGIGVSLVIITGGIDLSIGSLIGLTGCILPMLLVEQGWSIPASLAAVMAISLFLGLVHGLLITKLHLQPFIVTLCGLLIYRGVARWIASDQTKGFGTAYDDSLRLLAIGKPCSMAFLIVLAGVGTFLWFVWSAIQARKQIGENGISRSYLLAGMIIGAVMILVGAARYLPLEGVQGLVAKGALEFKSWSMKAPQTSEDLPQALMQWGWLGLIPSLGWLLVAVFRRDWKRGVLPVLSVGVGIALVCAALWIVRQPNSWFTPSAAWAGTWKMTSVFVSLGILMGAIGWLFKRSSTIAGNAAVAPLMLTGFFGVLLLIGQTPLAKTPVPAPFLFLIVMAGLAGIFLNQTIYGRYLLALGRSEEAATYSGIRTDRMIILAYVLCGAASGIGGILFALDGNSIQPAGHGNFLELYAIAAAVLGGCSLRGGEGTILGVIIGAAVMRVLYNAINILGIPSQLEFAIIGIVILFGVLADELVRRFSSRRKPLPELPA